ncbi:MAG: dehydrogenase, partial [Akkermansiaceae bacterium]|nr:dehydrogenase [Akkermansiaceae bacterium]
LFGVIVLVAWLVYGGKPSNDLLEEFAAKDRYEKRAKVDDAQAANFAYKVVEEGKTVQVPPHDVFALVGKHLAETKAAPVKQDTQVVPGGAEQKRRTDAEKASGATTDYSAVDKLTPAADAPIDPAQMEIGKVQFVVCSACHGMDGKGASGASPLAPPLENSEWVKGPVSNLIRIQLRGLQGDVHVQGKVWPLPAPMMAPLAYQTDEQIAGVLTYVRNSFGNKGSAVLPEQVKMLRTEVGKPFLVEGDLIKP